MVNHEKWCHANPENDKACYNCQFLEETTISYIKSTSGPWGESEEEKTAKGFRCTKLDQLLYPLKVEKKRLPEYFPETFTDQLPMPKECESQKAIYEPWQYDI